MRDVDLERVLVALIAAHSVGVGLILLAAPAFALRFGGWDAQPTLFFLRQAGVFHFVVAFGYLTEHLRHRGIALLLFAKLSAFVFLLGATLVAAPPWAVPFCGAADGAMALAVLAARRFAPYSRRS